MKYRCVNRRRNLRLEVMLCCAVFLAARHAPVRALDLLGGDDDLGAVDEMWQELFAPPDDRDLLRYSHYSEIARWEGVAPARPAADLDLSDFGWQAERAAQQPPRTLVKPLGDRDAWTVLNIPAAREYRVWLGYEAYPGRTRPVTLTFSGSNDGHHRFGELRLGLAQGGDLEKTLPIRFDDAMHRITTHSRPIVIWEYVDLPFNAGPTRVAITSHDPAVRVDGLFISACQLAVAPGKSILEDDGTLYRTWCRVRVSETGEDVTAYSVPGVALTYHWRRIPQNRTEPVWYWRLGSADGEGFVGTDGQSNIPIGSWTRWVEVTQDLMDGTWARGGGPWATGRVAFRGVTQGVSEIQLGWYPHDGAVLKTVVTGIRDGQAVCMMPLERLSLGPVAATNDADGVWGMRRPEILDRMESAEAVHERHFEWGRAALADLDLADDHPLPRRIRIATSFNPAPAARETALRMLAAMGINDLPAPPALRQELGLDERTIFIGAADSQYLCHTHDPLDPVAEQNFEATLRARADTILEGREADPPLVRIKMGDEIGPIGGGAKINGFETVRAAFHDYLRAQLIDRATNSWYYGVADVTDLPFLDRMGERPGRHERRLYYDSQRFKFVLTAMYYAQLTRAAERVFPRVETYCNFSPHPPMFGGNMNGSEWFYLTRQGGANMAWGECWAGGQGGWGFTGFEVVSYYAAWVECAARTHGGLPGGFYVVGNLGGSERKIFSLIGRGIFNITAYSWGPLYAGAEGSNFWSENPPVYGQVALATHAIGPADEILFYGRREPRRVAVLYNRTHEIWNGGDGGFQTDRLITFTALAHAHLPAELILEEDCTDQGLEGYRVIYIQGYAIETTALEALRRWVEAGGVLIGGAGTAMRDESNTTTDAAETLFGARQRMAGQSGGGWHPQSLPNHQPIDTLTLQPSEWTPALTAAVIGVKAELTPTTGQSVGTFANGASAAVVHVLGKGTTLLLGVQPGMLYKGSAAGGSRYMLERRPLISRPAEKALGRMRVEYSEPQTEVWLFEHENRIAVTLNNFAFIHSPQERPTELTVQTDIPVREVVSTLRGALPWTRDGDRIRVAMTSPSPVDIIILR